MLAASYQTQSLWNSHRLCDNAPQCPSGFRSSSESGDSEAYPFDVQPEKELGVPTPGSLSDSDQISTRQCWLERVRKEALEEVDDSFDEEAEMEDL